MPNFIRYSFPFFVWIGCLSCGGIHADPDSRDADERRLGTLDLGARSDTDTVRKIVTLLEDPDDLVRDAALRALERIGHKEFSQHVKPKLHDPSPTVRVTAVEVLLKLDGREAFTVLLPAWRQEPDPSVRVAVLDRLDPYAADPMVIETLLDAVDDRDVRVSFAAHDMLGRANGQPSVQRSKQAWQDWYRNRKSQAESKN